MRAIYRDDFARAPPRRKQNAAWRLCPAKISIRKIFAAQVGESEFQRQTANATNLPQFWASRAAIETLRSANASPNFLFPKFSRRNLGRRRFQRQTLEAEGSNNKPRMKLPYHNFWPPASRVKRCVAPLFREIFRIQNFHGPSWRKQVPKTNHNPTNLPQFWAPRVAIETLRRANASPTFSFPIFAAQPWWKKVPKANLGSRRFQQHAANEATLPQFLATCVASETLRGASASPNIRCAKFSRPELGKASPEGKPRIQPTCHNFGPPALQSKRCVAPMLRQIFRSQNFRDATLEEEGSEGKPYKEIGSNDKPRCQLLPCRVREACESKVVTKEATCL